MLWSGGLVHAAWIQLAARRYTQRTVSHPAYPSAMIIYGNSWGHGDSHCRCEAACVVVYHGKLPVRRSRRITGVIEG
jgi:hypothetical protein